MPLHTCTFKDKKVAPVCIVLVTKLILVFKLVASLGKCVFRMQNSYLFVDCCTYMHTRSRAHTHACMHAHTQRTHRVAEDVISLQNDQLKVIVSHIIT